MSEGNLVATMLLCNIKQGFPPCPGAKETRGFTGIGRSVETRLMHEKGKAVLVCPAFQVTDIRTIRNIRHHDMCHDHLEPGPEYLGTASEQIHQRQRIFPPRQSDQYAVAIHNQAVFEYRLLDFLFYFTKQEFLFCQLCHTLLIKN